MGAVAGKGKADYFRKGIIRAYVNIRKSDLKTEPAITNEHVKNNKDVRGLLLKSGIEPENLPAEEDLKKVERKVRSEDKKLLKETKKLKRK
jgi:DNA-damage-inducible protein D